MTLRKKLLAATATVMGALLLALLVTPLLFKGRIVAVARARLDRAVAAHVDWSHVGLTFFRDFPHVTLSVDDLTVEGRDRFAGDTVAAVGSLRLVLDASSVFRAWRGRGDIVVRSVRVDDPLLHLSVLKDGTPNWALLRRPSGAGGAGGAAPAGGTAGRNASAARPSGADNIGVDLRSLAISGGALTLDDMQSGLLADIGGLDFNLGGNLSRDRVVVATVAHASHATLRFAGVPYLDGVSVDFRADVDADMKAGHFAFADNELRLNDLAVRFSGDATKTGDGVALDVRFSAPRTDFGQALSLVPAIYAHDFSTLRTAGSFTVAGTVRGTLGRGSMPAFSLTADVKNGMFRYPDLPLPARDIALHVSVENASGTLDSTVVRVDPLHVVVGDQPLDARLILRTPVSDPDVDAGLRGTLDLADVPRTVKLDQVQELAGTVKADASVRARLSDVDAGRFDHVTARGTVTARDVAVRAQSLRHPVAVHEASLELTPRRAELKSLDARVGGSDLQAEGWLDNVLGFALKHEPLHGSATFTSRHFVLDDWKSKDPSLEVIPVPADLDLALKGTIDTLTYGPLQMTAARGAVTVADQRLTMNDFSLQTLGGRMGFKGTYDTSDPARPTFDVSVNIDSMDVARAAADLLTVRTLAPVGRYARGSFSTQLDLSGVLNHDMTPVFDALDGKGILTTSRLVLEGFPAMEKLAGALSIPRLSNPTFNAIRSSIDVQDGRLHVRPFRVKVGDVGMSIEGSNGIDRSMDYTVGLTLPRAALGSAADQVVKGLAAKAGKAGLDLQAADSVRLGVKLGGTVTSPTVDLGLGEAVTNVRQQVAGAAGAAVDRGLDEARAKRDSAAAEVRRRAQARADSLVAAAQTRADQVRAEAKKLADQVRAEGNKRADAVVAAAKNPVARAAAEPVAKRIRQEAAAKADGIVAEAEKKADDIVAEARKQADELVGKAGGGGDAAPAP